MPFYKQPEIYLEQIFFRNKTTKSLACKTIRFSPIPKCNNPNNGVKMKLKLLLLATDIVGASLTTKAETVMGEIIAISGNNMAVQTNDGQKMSFKTTDNTNYRKKKMKHHRKFKRGSKEQAMWTYEPIAEEDDWVEITYNPKTGEEDIYEVQTITVLDD